MSIAHACLESIKELELSEPPILVFRINLLHGSQSLRVVLHGRTQFNTLGRRLPIVVALPLGDCAMDTLIVIVN
jgi:hypothetical protein